jgi:hypothetical protein
MFAKGSKSSGGSGAFSLECRKIPRPAMTGKRLDPPLPPLLLLPALMIQGP